MKKITINDLINLDYGKEIKIDYLKNNIMGIIGIQKIIILGEPQIAIGLYGAGTTTYVMDYIEECPEDFIKEVNNKYGINIIK